MRIFPFKIWMWRRGYLANLAWMCCDKGSSTYPLHDSFFVFAFASYWQKSRFGLRWILLYTCYQMMLTHVSNSSLKGALSLTSYGIFLMNWKNFLFGSLCLMIVFVMLFKVRPARRWGGSIMNGFGQGIYAPGMKDQRTAQSYFSAHGWRIHPTRVDEINQAGNDYWIQVKVYVVG